MAEEVSEADRMPSVRAGKHVGEACREWVQVSRTRTHIHLTRPAQHQKASSRLGSTDPRAPTCWRPQPPPTCCPPYLDSSELHSSAIWHLTASLLWWWWWWLFEKMAYRNEEALTAGWVAAIPTAPPLSRKAQLLFGISHCIYQLGQEGWLSKPFCAVGTKLKKYGEREVAWWV